MMKEKKEILSYIDRSLKNNKKFLEYHFLELIGEMIDSPFYKIATFQTYRDITVPIDKNILEQTLKDTINSDENFVYKGRHVSVDGFTFNEIYSDLNNSFPKSRYDINYLDKYYGINRSIIAHECFNNYLNSDLIKDFDKFSDFEAFFDSVVDTSGYYDYLKTHRLNINTTGWNNYVRELIEYFFLDYKYSAKFSNSNARFVKQLDKAWYLGIEYAKNHLNKSRRSGFFEFPYYFNIVLINANYDKRSKADYIYRQEDDNIVSFGILGNRFFFYPTISPTGYAMELASKYKKDPYTVYAINQMALVTEIGDKKHIQYRKDEALLLKKYMYYYIDITRKTSRSYLDYIEKSILDILNT